MIELSTIDLVSLDIVLGAILALSLILGFARGLVRTVTSVVIIFLSVFGGVWVARMFAPRVTAWAMPHVEGFVMERIIKSGAMTASQAADFAAGDSSMLADLGAAAKDMYNGALQSGMEALSAVVEKAVHGVAFMIIFFVAMALLSIVLRLLSRPLRLVERIPVFGFLNRLGGAAVGLVLGVLICLLVSAVVRLTGLVDGEGTYLYSFFAGHTPRSLLALLQK